MNNGYTNFSYLCSRIASDNNVKEDNHNIFAHTYTDLYASVAECCIGTCWAQRCGDATQDRPDKFYPDGIRSSGEGVAHI